jgi:acyl transferase domain-containing protein/acyl carrier protein
MSGEEYAVEPIAVVGLACRVPGARDAAQFWANLAAGVESIRFYTRDEQLKLGAPADEVDHPDFVPAAAVLDDIAYFDAGYFGMTDREADVTDPQQRLFLELAGTALDDAGYDPARYPGEIGVYAGTGANDYLWKNVRRNPRVARASGNLSVSIGNNPDYVATLTSYKLNLRGPSFTLHTACSTSLVAIHLAAEALRGGECDLALAGGVCIELPHGAGYIAYDGGISSADGHCRPFDSRASGTLWGSGGGIVVLKRLGDAVADGDHVRALILGNAINNDGAAKVGFSAPSVEGQAGVVAQALGVAGIAARTVSYVEAHGTATALGDPIEVTALSRAYGADTADTQWCRIGSVKSNVGHLSQAAGVVGLIKAVLAMEHGLIPPSVNYEKPNPAIDFDASPFYVNAVLSTWDTGGEPRRAGVSSFGIGGTNAHVVLEQAPPPRPAEPAGARAAELIQVSARGESALARVVEGLADHLTAHPQTPLADVAYTLRAGRGVHGYRATVVATDALDAAAGLRDRKRRVTGYAGAVPPRVAFLLSGQGSQHPGMAAELYRAEPVFRDAVDACAEILGDDPLAGDAAHLNRTEHAQPALFTVEYALAKLWQGWGVHPAAMIGHSIGEYVAATLAGVFPLPDALRLVAARGRLMQPLPAGSMLAVQAAADELRADLPDGLAVAVVNGPGTAVVAGPTELVEEYAAALREREIRHRPLRTSHAFHSPVMDPILDKFTELVAAVPRYAPRLPFLSNRTGTWITAEQATDPGYWAAHLRETVRFGDCVATLLADGDWALLECGPGAQLANLARMQVPAGGRVPLASLPGPGDKYGDLHVLYGSAGKLWTAGVALDGFGSAARRVPLPAYPFERSYHWVDPAPELADTAPVPAVPSGPRPMAQWCSVPVWRQLPPAGAHPAPQRVLLLADGEVADGLAAWLGPGVVRVASGPAYRAGDGGYAVRPGEPDDYAALLADLATAGGVPPRVVHAWCLSASDADRGDSDRGDADRGDADQGDADLDAPFHSPVAFAQALAGVELAERVHLDVLTAGTRDVIGGDVTRPGHATAVGVVAVLPLELPAALSARHLDAATPGDLAALATEVAVPPSGEQGETVALRNGRRWVPGLAPVPLPEEAPVLRTGGVYLVTGGLGGIGITVAEDLATRYRAKLVLLTRTGLPPRDRWPALAGTGGRVGRAIAAIRRIEAAGGEALVLAADVTVPGDLRRVRAATLERFGRLDGIVHAAGVPGGGLVEVKTRAAAEAVLAPKVSGTRALAEVFGDLELDFVALCASITGVVGGIGQVDYAAANAFLDAYAHSGYGFRGRVTSVDWGAWLEVGMAAEVARPGVLDAVADAPLAGPAEPVDHPVLTARGAAGWLRGVVGAATHWTLAEHRISGVPVLPGTAHLEIARAAVACAVPAPVPDAVVELRDVTFLAPLAVPDGTSAELRVLLEPADDGVDFQIVSGGRTHVRGNGGWVAATAPAGHDLTRLVERCGPELDLGPSYHESRSGLLTFGPRWASLRAVRRRGDEALSRLTAPEAATADVDRWVLHPALLDEATSFVGGGGDGAYLPIGYGRVTVYGPMPATLWSYVRLRGGGEISTADIQVLDDAGRVVVDIAEFMMRRIDTAAVAGSVGAAPAPVPADPVATVGIRPADGAEVLRRLLGGALGRQVVVTARTVAEQIERVRALTTSSVADRLAPAGAPARDGDVEAPRTELEAQLATVWSEVLGVPAVARDDDFFELGGNSLVAVQLIGQVRKTVGVKLPMRSLFEAATVAGMAELVEKLRAAPDRTGAGTAPPSEPAVTIPRLARPQ